MNKKIEYPAVILSGGKSTRMETDKSLLKFGEYESLTEYQYKKYQELFEAVYISSKTDKFRFLKDKSFLILDDNETYSPMVALKRIFEKLQSEYIFIIAVDIPFVSIQTINKLYTYCKKNHSKIVIVEDSLGNTHNLCGFFHKDTLEVIKRLLKNDNHKIGLIFDDIKSDTIMIENKDEFLNLNDKTTYKKALTLFNSSNL